jgi:hypothetical protein
MRGTGSGPRVALQPRGKDATVVLDGIDLSGAGDEYFFDVPFKCRVVYAGMIVTTVIASDTAEVKFDRRFAANNDTGRSDGTIAYIKIPSGTAIGQMVYDKAAQDKLTEAAAALLTTEDTCHAGGGIWKDSKCQNYDYGYLEPGMEVVVQLISTSATGKGLPILVVDVEEEVWGNLANATETA